MSFDPQYVKKTIFNILVLGFKKKKVNKTWVPNTVDYFDNIGLIEKLNIQLSIIQLNPILL